MYIPLTLPRHPGARQEPLQAVPTDTCCVPGPVLGGPHRRLSCLLPTTFTSQYRDQPYRTGEDTFMHLFLHLATHMYLNKNVLSSYHPPGLESRNGV